MPAQLPEDIDAYFLTSPGQDLDPHCGLHNCLWGHVCQDLEGSCHLQECEDEEEGMHTYLGDHQCLLSLKVEKASTLDTCCIAGNGAICGGFKLNTPPGLSAYWEN